MATGWKPDLPDIRDASWDRLIGIVAEAPPPSFSRPVPDYIPFQDSINCCVWATIAALQEWFSRQENRDEKLSFRYGYGNTAGGTGGRSYRESADWQRNYGIPEDSYCPNDWTIGANKFLDVSAVTPEGKDNAQIYRIKNYSFVSTGLDNLKSACFRQPIPIAIGGNNTDWVKPYDQIVQFTGRNDWYHSVLLWDWTENYIGVLNWWGDRYRKLSNSYPIQAGMSFEDLPDDWRLTIMDYVILGKEQFLTYPSLKIAFNIGDEVELAALQMQGLQGVPREVADTYFDGYRIYPLVQKDRLRDLFGL